MVNIRQLFDEVAEENEVKIEGQKCSVWLPNDNLSLVLAVELPTGEIANLDVAPEKRVNPKTGEPSLVYKLEPTAPPPSLDRATLLRLKEICRPIFGGYQVDLRGLLGEADDEDPHEPPDVVHTGDDELLDRIGNAKGFVDRILEETNARVGDPSAPTRADYDAASPRGKGWLEYTYSNWPNSEVPKGCPFAVGTKEHRQFVDGQNAAMLAAQDSEE